MKKLSKHYLFGLPQSMAMHGAVYIKKEDSSKLLNVNGLMP